MNLQKLHKCLLEDLDESSLLKSIKKLQQIFLRKTQSIDIENYTNNSTLVSAYAYFYFSTNYKKFSFLWEQLPLEIRELISNGIFIDYGSGPGTYSFGLCNELEKDGLAPKSILAIDKSDLMLEQGKKIFDQFYPQQDIKFQKKINKIKDHKTLFFGNSINEMGHHNVSEIIEEISPNVVLLIEPGTKESFKEILALRKKLALDNFISLYPCAQINLRCPLNTDDWCHQVYKTTHSQSVERICQKVKLDRRSMPMIAHAYVLNDSCSLKEQGVATTIRVLSPTKFALYLQVCLEIEEELKILKFEIPNSVHEKKDLKKWSKQSVGRQFKFEVIKKLNVTHFRVKIKRFL